MRVVSQRDPATDQGFDHLMFGWEVNYGRQLHAGIMRGTDTGTGQTGADLMAFVRLSYLLRLLDSWPRRRLRSRAQVP